MTEPLTLAQPVWPLNGYAPGGYTCICCTCEKHFDGDKRATTCLECAITRLCDANKALTAENEEISAKYSGAVERALSILAAKNHWHDKFRDAEAELAQANKCIEALNICIKQDDERESVLSAELAEARADYLNASRDASNLAGKLNAAEAVIERALESLCGDYPSMAADFRSFLSSKEASQ